MFFFPTFSSILHLGLIDIHPCACFFLVCPSVNSGGIGSGGGERITAMEFTSKVIPSALWVFNTTTTTTKCSGADILWGLKSFSLGFEVISLKELNVKQIKFHTFAFWLILRRDQECAKKSEKRKQCVKQRGGARRNTKTQTQKSRKAKSQEHSCKMSQFQKVTPEQHLVQLHLLWGT